MSLLQIRGSDAQETYNSLINSIPTKCLFGPKHWHVDEERTKKREREHRVGGGQDRASGQRVWVLTGWLLSLSTVASISQIWCPSGKI